MKKIELPSSLGSLHVPNCPPQAALALFVDYWRLHKQPVGLVVGESLPGAENKCEDIAALYEGFYPGCKVDFHTFDKQVSPDNPDAFEKACDRLTLLSALRSVDLNNKEVNPILVATTMDALLGTCPLLHDCEDSQISLLPAKDYSYQQFSQDLIDKLDYSSEVVCEEPGQFAHVGGSLMSIL